MEKQTLSPAKLPRVRALQPLRPLRRTRTADRRIASTSWPAGMTCCEIARELAREIRYALAGTRSSRPLEILIDDVLRERDRLPVPAVIPTIDRRPLTLAKHRLGNDVDRGVGPQ
jgi:hypothetical protein